MTTRRVGWIIAIVVAILLLVLLGQRTAGYIPTFAGYVESLGVIGPLAFMAGYVAATIALVPGSLLTLAAGALFGLVRGTVFVFIGASLGATAAFLIGRHLARDVVVRRMEGNTRFQALDRAIARDGRRIVFLIRLSPIFPFNLTNYVLGLTDIRLRDYVMACLGMLPGTVLYVYYGRLIGDVAAAVSGTQVARGTAYWLLTATGLVATVLATLLIARAARRALRSAAIEPPH